MTAVDVSEFMLRDLAGTRLDLVCVEYEGVRLTDLIVGDVRVILSSDRLDDLIEALEACRG